MKAIDIIIKTIEELGLTQNQAAEMAGMSRQNLWDKLNKGNPRWNSMERIMNAFGYQIVVSRMDGKDLDFSQYEFLETAREENLCFDAVSNILESMGYQVRIEKV